MKIRNTTCSVDNGYNLTSAKHYGRTDIRIAWIAFSGAEGIFLQAASGQTALRSLREVHPWPSCGFMGPVGSE
ncbi:Hypp197 [Branchiostoma lanceolatum]|uniref:Hypp197 protein n=1 Tax=Branchiostoma lanceolatum TaxID=7740 RepID=A0A8J9VXM9_BRALA|nr:Hypp197 [Branchiostoma lanceolatum]